MAKYVITKTKGKYLEETNYWGTSYSKVEIPDGVEDSIVDSFHLNPDLPKISLETWDAAVTMYFDYAKTGWSLEAHTLFYLHPKTNTWYILVPEQIVSGGSVDVDNYDKLVDIITGQEIFYSQTDEYGLEWAGTSHSHGTMALDDFSAKDDRDELKMSGIHILVSTINPVNFTYKITASIVAKGIRYYFDPKHIIKDISNHASQRVSRQYHRSFTTDGSSLETFYINLNTSYSKKVNDQIKMSIREIKPTTNIKEFNLNNANKVEVVEKIVPIDLNSTRNKNPWSKSAKEEEEENFYLDPYYESSNSEDVSKFVEEEFKKQSKGAKRKQNNKYKDPYNDLYTDSYYDDEYSAFFTSADDNCYEIDYLDMYIDELLQMGYTLKDISRKLSLIKVEDNLEYI